MKFSSKKLLAISAIPMLLAACASNGDNVAQVTPTDLQHHNWQLTQIDGNDIAVGEHQQAPRLEVAEKMTANGNAGCNNFFGQAELNDEGQFRIKQMGMTMKMCPDSEMEIERAVSVTLSDWSDITLTKDTLTLENDAHTLTYTLRDWVN